ncbi:hypothetical protein GCM10022239_17010 [Leifsonia bigeumensis]|uniref:Uncharacterized protein n=1 Tax=Leifsonella bigeumensis TaxID=433643 RepID=A0ABP7FMR2_9MICO
MQANATTPNMFDQWTGALLARSSAASAATVLPIAVRVVNQSIAEVLCMMLSRLPIAETEQTPSM